MNDRCAVCFAELRSAPHGGRYACEMHPRAGYWSTARPEDGHTQKACLVSRYRGKPTLHYYGYLK